MRVVRLVRSMPKNIRIMCLVGELIKCLPDKETFGCAERYYALLKCIVELHLSLISNILPNIWDHKQGHPVQ